MKKQQGKDCMCEGEEYQRVGDKEREYVSQKGYKVKKRVSRTARWREKKDRL